MRLMKATEKTAATTAEQQTIATTYQCSHPAVGILNAAQAICEGPSNTKRTRYQSNNSTNRNSPTRSCANWAGLGNSSARFFVQPSFICGQVRYMRVRT